MATNKSTIILDAKDKTGRAFAQADANIKRLDAGVAKLAGTFALLAGGGAIGGFVKSAIDAGDNIQKLSVRLGASTEELSQLEHVAKLSGVSFQTMTMGLQRMTRRVAEAASGTGEAKDAIAELGFSAEALNKLGMSEKFKALAGAIKSVENPADRVRLAMKLFDSEGVALVQTMEEGSEGIAAMMAEADALGKTLSQAAAEDMAAANDAIARMGTAFEGLGVKLAALVSGPLAEFATAMTDAFFPSNADQRVKRLAELTEQLDLIGARMQALAELEDPTLDNIRELGLLTTQYEKLGAEYDSIRDKQQKQEKSLQSIGVHVETLTAGTEKLTKKEKDRKLTLDQMVGIENDLNALFKERTDIFGELAVKYDDILGSEEGLVQAAKAANEVFAEQMDRIDDLVNSDLEAAFDDMPEIFSGKMEESTNQMEEIWGNAIENMQGAFSDTIYDALWEDGIDSFSDFGDALVDIWKRMIAEMVAAWVTSGIAGILSGQGTSGFNWQAFTGSAGGGSGSGWSIFGSGATASAGGASAGGLGAGTLGSASVSAAYTGGGAAGPAGVAAQGGGSAATGGAGAGSGAMAGAGILAALYALSAWSNSSQAKIQRHYQGMFDRGEGDFTQSGAFTEFVGTAFGGTSGGMNRIAFDSQGNRFQAWTDGIEDVREAMSALTPEIQAFMVAESEALEQSLQGTMKREDAMGLLVEGQKQMAAEFEVSHRLGQDSNEEMTNVIIGNFGSIETSAAMVSAAISDGFISSSEAAAAGLDEGAVGMIASLRAVGREAEVAASKVFTIGGGSDGGTGTTQVGGPRVQGRGRGQSSFATGGIARGPLSGYGVTMHGTEGIVPLDNGDKMKAPVIIQGGNSDAAIEAMRRDIRDLKNAVLRRGRLAA